MMPIRICTRINADTTQKYLMTARCDGVATDVSSGSFAGTSPSGSCAGRDACHQADAGEQDDDADAGPDDGFAGRTVADERLVRPVARVGHRIVWPVGRRGPRGPEDEGGELTRTHRVLERTGRDRVLRPPVAEEGGVVLLVGRERARALEGDRQLSGGRVIRI